MKAKNKPESRFKPERHGNGRVKTISYVKEPDTYTEKEAFELLGYGRGLLDNYFPFKNSLDYREYCISSRRFCAIINPSRLRDENGNPYKAEVHRAITFNSEKYKPVESPASNG